MLTPQQFSRRKSVPFSPARIRLEVSDEKLTAAAGLTTIIEIFDSSPFGAEFAAALPKRSTFNSRSKGSYRIGLSFLQSLIYGHDSLDDLDEFRDEPLLQAAMKGDVMAPRTAGDFLRDFGPEEHDKMNQFLSRMARGVRKFLREVLPEEHRPNEAPIVDMDSTSHVQQGLKTEGCAWNYKDEWGLCSEVAFDELGFCHAFQLAPGNTKPGSTCIPLIEQCFAGMKFADLKYFRGDSAYCYEAVFRTLIRLGVTYSITAHDGTTNWRSHIDEVTEWIPWVYSAEELEHAAKRKRELPRVEVGRFYWRPNWSPDIRIPIVLKRTWKEPEQLGLFSHGTDNWQYYAVATNHDLFHNTLQSLLEFHQKRGNSENFIREEKYGFDLKHFPCLALHANYGYGQLAVVAHNLLRWVALVQKPDKPHFSKKLRRRLIFIPGKLTNHARQLVLRIPARFLEEVTRLHSGLRFNPRVGTGIARRQSAFASGFA